MMMKKVQHAFQHGSHTSDSSQIVTTALQTSSRPIAGPIVEQAALTRGRAQSPDGLSLILDLLDLTQSSCHCCQYLVRTPKSPKVVASPSRASPMTFFLRQWSFDSECRAHIL